MSPPPAAYARDAARSTRSLVRRRRAAVATLIVATTLAPLRAPATVEEQRARLPPPASCADPIEGTWRALRYAARLRTWNLQTLSVRRGAPGGGALVGQIVAESWTGDAAQTSPPRCGPAVRHWIVDQPAQGTWDDLTKRAQFWGTAWTVRQVLCERWVRYAPDHFAGTVDRELEEFQAVNNDGRSAVNEPTVFRRISCGELPAPSLAGPTAPSPPGRARRSCLPW